MSAISLKSITGITSITTPAGVDNQLTLHNNNTSEAVKLDAAGNLHFHNHLNITGISTASNFKTGTSNLHNTGLNVQDLDVDGHTNLDNVSIAGVTTTTETIRIGANNKYLKLGASDQLSLVTLGGISYITNSTGHLTGRSASYTWENLAGNTEYFRINSSGNVGINEVSPPQRLTVGGDVQIGFNTPNDAGRQINFNVNRSSAGDTLANINWQWNNKYVAQIRGMAGYDTTNKDDAHLIFYTSSANNLSARLRIHPDGGITIGSIAATTSKAGILHTRASTTTNPVVFENDTENCDVVIKTTGTNKHSILGFGDGANNLIGNIDYDHQNNSMVFDTNGGERLNISSAGVVTQVETGTGNGMGGIKASTASAGGNAGFGFITGGTQRFALVTIGSGGSEALRFYDNNNSAERLRIDANGNMGLGDTAPPNFTGYRTLSIHGSTGGALVFGDDGTDEWEIYGGDGVLKVYDRANTIERLRIDSDGNLSLGKGSAANASYGRNFQIHHDGTSGAALQLTDNNTGGGGGDGFHIISTSQIAYLWQRENANMVFGTQGIARWNMYGSNGHFAPHADSTYDIGTNTVRVRNIYADNLYGSGANLTSLPSSPPPNNFLINGAMQINVRGTNHQTAGSFNPVTSSIYTLDRWKVLNSNSFDTDSAKVVQDNGAPTSEGFRKSIMMNIGNTETPSSNQVCGFQQKIEAQNLQSLAYGTSSAKTMTLSFWVYSNKTGTYCVQIMQDDVNKYVLYEYTISSSNTWEKKTITVAGNTSDAINNDNGIGLEVNWILCVGSGRQASATSSWTSGGYYVATSNQVNLWDHPDNYFKMTGCQLQTGSTATDFVHEDIGTTLRKCQRYFYMACGPGGGGYETIGTGMIYYSGTGYANVYFPTTMRTEPSLVALSGTSGAYVYQTLLSNTAAYTHQISLDTGKTSLNSASVSCACPSNRNGQAFRLSAHFSHDANGGQSFVNFDAEL